MDANGKSQFKMKAVSKPLHSEMTGPASQGRLCWAVARLDGARWPTAAAPLAQRKLVVGF
jgi:hypothetical protein